jgi:hypothetical protein
MGYNGIVRNVTKNIIEFGIVRKKEGNIGKDIENPNRTFGVYRVEDSRKGTRNSH